LNKFFSYVEQRNFEQSALKYSTIIAVLIMGTTKLVVGLERGPLSLVSTTEELLGRKVAAPV
jgi:hypothetical protein